MANPVTIDTITFSDGGHNPVFTYPDVLKGKDFKIFATGQVVSDGCDPTSPAIAYNTFYMGPVTFRFSDTVSAVSFDAGCFNTARSSKVIIYGENNFKFKSVVNSNADGHYEHFSFDFGENVIKRIVIKPIGSDLNGFAVDNLSVTVRPEDRSVKNSGDKNIDNLVSGTKWVGHKITYSFLTAHSKQPDCGTGPETFDGSKVRAQTSQPFSAGQKAMTDAALALWAGVANLHFQKVNDSPHAPGMIRLGRADIGDVPADTFLPGHDGHQGDVRVNLTQPTAQVDPGRYEFSEVILHELGHALGLKHPHDTDGSGVVLPANKDSLEFSVMSYRSYPGQSIVGGGYTNKAGSYPHSLMMNDIAAIQYLYGANFKTNAGDTTYHFDPHKATIFETIWDGGGNDTYDASAYHVGVSIDLRPGKWSVLKHSQLAVLDLDPANLHLARASVFNARLYKGDERSLIENAIGGTKADKLIGNQGDNKLMGGNGNDTLDGLAGKDTLIGQDGKDSLFGGTGHDRLLGGNGDDLMNGNGAADHIWGGSGNDTLNGGNGNDVLRGGIGHDTMSGGSGDDSFVFGTLADSGPLATARDHIVDFIPGDDTIILSQIDANTTMGGNQDFTFIGTAHFSGTPGELRYFKLPTAIVVVADVNGDKVPDFSIQIDHTTHISAGDFLL